MIGTTLLVFNVIIVAEVEILIELSTIVMLVLTDVANSLHKLPIMLRNGASEH